MNNKKMRAYIRENYWKDNQKFLLETYYDVKDMKKRKSYFEQEISYKDYYFLNIQTWDILKYSENIAHTPYCIKSEFYVYQITVPKFGQLNDEDISKAIHYVLRKIDCWLIFNYYLDGKKLNSYLREDYTIDIEKLRWQNETRKDKKCSIL